jgi:hypothetical protein
MKRQGIAWGAIVGLGGVIAVWVPVFVAQELTIFLGFATAGIVGLALAWIYRQVDKRLALLPLIIASAALGSSLLPADSSRYLPLATALLGAFGALIEFRMSASLRERGPLVGVLALYVAYAAITTVFSIEPRTSLVYLVGMCGVLTFAFVVLPAASDTTVAFLASVLAAGLAIVALSLLLVFFGPIEGYGAPAGRYLLTEIGLFGTPTGVVVPRVAGPFLETGYQSIVMAVALVSALALRVTTARYRTALGLASCVFAVALLLTMVRTGYLIAMVGMIVIAIGFYRGRKGLLLPAGLLALVGGVFVLLLIGIVSVEARYDLTAERYRVDLVTANVEFRETPDAEEPGDQADPGNGGSGLHITEKSPIRGGVSLSGRLDLWLASAEAIAQRPVMGYGLGTNVAAIEPYTRARGFERELSPHSTPLRTGVELGLPGMLLMIMVVAIAAWLGIRTALSDPDPLRVGVLGITLGLVAGGLFITLLLGGLTFGSLVAAIGMGLLSAGTPVRGRRVENRAASSAAP